MQAAGSQMTPGGLTEGGRFELPTRRMTGNGFRDRRIRPLCHPSARKRFSSMTYILVTFYCLPGARKAGYYDPGKQTGNGPPVRDFSPDG